ncbi:hypothetical protein [Kerstersia similis]|uniref:hypothetical protein n=1 Tax=Kerstersia similis TaxID=206505 RepID=UPI0039EF9ED1
MVDFSLFEPMNLSKLPFFLALGVVLLAGCTTQEKQLVKELENLPGVTCDIADSGAETDCHPDSLKATQGP